MAAPRWSFRWSSLALCPALLAVLAPPGHTQQPLADGSACDRPSLPADVTARYVAHYEAVERELREARIPELDGERRAARDRAIELLVGYREAADFGVNTSTPGARVPHFRDDWGRHCAVAHLMHATGATDLVDSIAATQNTAWFSDLAELDEVVAWADHNGLTLAELTRMHGPAFGGPAAPAPSSSGPSGSGGTGSGTGGGFARPVTIRPTTGQGTGTPEAKAKGVIGYAPRHREQSGGDCSISAGRSIVSRTDPGREVSTGSATSVTGAGHVDDWWTWWELNKSEFLELNRLQVAAPPLTGSRYRFGSGIATELRDEVAAAARPELLEALADRDAEVRSRAAVAYARIAGGEAVPALLPLLDDTDMGVRHSAILGLGATGSPTAVPALLRIAADGRLAAGDGQISAWARPLALTALGLGRRHGLPDSIDAFVADMLLDSAEADDVDVGAASLVYDRLARADDLGSRALEVFRDEDADAMRRCRATESLGLTADGALLPQITSALSGPDLEVRRSAALALGGFHHALIAPRLQTAFELEEDALTRGFILVALGRQGGTGACDFVRRTLTDGPAAARPWAALSLGLMARLHGDDEARQALRAALKDGPTTAHASAFALACGIAREARAEEWLSHALVEGSSPRLRMASALSLAMIRSEGIRPLLRERLAAESSPQVKVGLAQALGHFGEVEDAEVLLHAVRDISNPELQSQVAAAMGFHGTDAALQGLFELATDTHGSASARAAAWDALGLLLDTRPGLMLADVSAGANFAVFPDWVTAVVTSQTL